MGKNKKSSLDSLYNGKGEVKTRSRLHPDFLRPVYQYTSQGLRNQQRNSGVDKDEDELKEG